MSISICWDIHQRDCTSSETLGDNGGCKVAVDPCVLYCVERWCIERARNDEGFVIEVYKKWSIISAYEKGLEDDTGNRSEIHTVYRAFVSLKDTVLERAMYETQWLLGHQVLTMKSRSFCVLTQLMCSDPSS